MNESPVYCVLKFRLLRKLWRVKFAILSPNLCHNNNKVLRQTLDITFAVFLDFCILSIELASSNFACAFLITFTFFFYLFRRVLLCPIWCSATLFYFYSMFFFYLFRRVLLRPIWCTATLESRYNFIEWAIAHPDETQTMITCLKNISSIKVRNYY